MNSGTHIPRFPEDLEGYIKENDPADLKDLSKTWSLLGAAAPADNHEHVDEALNRLRMALADKDENRQRPRLAKDRGPRQSQRKGFRTRPVAFLSTAVMAMLLFLYWPVTVDAPMGQQTSVLLPDGSSIELNSGSSIRYARFFRSMPLANRIHLEGEAFFDVTHGKGLFEVQTSNSDIQVLGTSFNVRSWKNESKTTVVVTEGRVLVNDREGQANVILTMDEMAEVGSQPLKKKASSDLPLVWRQGGLYLADETLPDVVNELSRRFNTRIIVNATASTSGLETIHYSNATDVESILQDLCVKHELKYRPVAGGYELFR